MQLTNFHHGVTSDIAVSSSRQQYYPIHALVMVRDVHKPEYRSRLRQEFQCFNLSRSRIRSHKFPIVAGAGVGSGVKTYRILVIFVQNLP